MYNNIEKLILCNNNVCMLYVYNQKLLTCNENAQTADPGIEFAGVVNAL